MFRHLFEKIKSKIKPAKKAVPKKANAKKKVEKSKPGKFKNRFQKFYCMNKSKLNQKRRSIYTQKKKKGICVKCRKKAVEGSVFCSMHKKK